MSNGEKKRTPAWVIVATLGLAAVVKFAIVLWGLAKAGWKGEAPVPYHVFLLVTAVELAALLFLFIKILFFNYAVLG